MDVDVIAGLDMMVQRKQWDKAIETAEQQVSSVAQGRRDSKTPGSLDQMALIDFIQYLWYKEEQSGL